MEKGFICFLLNLNKYITGLNKEFEILNEKYMQLNPGTLKDHRRRQAPQPGHPTRGEIPDRIEAKAIVTYFFLAGLSNTSFCICSY